ncbi:MAG: hypothetical protein HRT90_10515 [Candidatus Margulisbacteria bacterium]|nr:hypothetical protein [Candidatus Margulisiibacteriota bacterium]
MSKAEELAYFIQRIGNEAVKKAQESNLKKGAPNVYSKNGVIYYQLPNLEITTKDPFKRLQNKKKKSATKKSFKK